MDHSALLNSQRKCPSISKITLDFLICQGKEGRAHRAECTERIAHSEYGIGHGAFPNSPEGSRSHRDGAQDGISRRDPGTGRNSEERRAPTTSRLKVIAACY